MYVEEKKKNEDIISKIYMYCIIGILVLFIIIIAVLIWKFKNLIRNEGINVRIRPITQNIAMGIE